jgi:4'-phosphopantetheinyl transferase
MPGRSGARLMALAVQAWPAPLAGWDQGLVVIGIVTPVGTAREVQRARIRQALREALARLLDVGLGQVAVESSPGSAPRVLVDGARCGIGISVSHAGGMSAAALRRDGPVGIDLMEVQEVSDWARVALDYLGMATASRLASMAPGDRTLAFAQAWSEREASLKLFGLPLDEWTPLPADCTVKQLSLPLGLAGALALPPD